MRRYVLTCDSHSDVLRLITSLPLFLLTLLVRPSLFPSCSRTTTMSFASPSPSPSPLRALAALISSSVDILEDAYAQHGLVYPSLNDAYHNANEADSKVAQDVNVVKACATICAAANQLVYSVRDPKASALFAASSVSLRFACLLGVTY